MKNELETTSRRLVVLCDFDGTAVQIDTLEYLLEKYGRDDWKRFNDYLERGEISLEECLEKQLSMLKMSKPQMIAELDGVVAFRSYFKELIDLCRRRHIPFTIVSAGLDFIIKYFIHKQGWMDLIDIYAGRTEFIDQSRIKITFPVFREKTSLDFKEDLVRCYRADGFFVIYVGDGLSDLNAIKRADSPFVIADSKLADLCEKHGISHQRISDFHEVITTLSREFTVE